MTDKDAIGNLSGCALAALDQLRQGDVWDGDLVSKSGRTELVQAGIAERTYGGINRLTLEGRAIAARMMPDNWHGGTRQ